MKKISWCKKQSNGIKIQEPNDNLSDEYYRTAEESMKVLQKIKGDAIKYVDGYNQILHRIFCFLLNINETRN
ncbi:hypothetical protein J4442_00435 [Candidatus Woesearchaeota archaeon]|nr:hypothetical protein [Candidatus Woesearchaeota archaeon]